MATHSSVLTWRIPETGEPGGLPFMGSHRVGHNWSDLAAVVAAREGNNHPNVVHASHIIGKILCLAEYFREILSNDSTLMRDNHDNINFWESCYKMNS